MVTSLDGCLADMESQVAASCLHRDVLQTAYDNLLKSRGTDQEEISTLRHRVQKLEADLQTLRYFLLDLLYAVRDEDHYKMLLQFIAAYAQRLQACYACIMRCVQGNQTFLCDGLGFLLKEFEPPSLGYDFVADW